MEGDRAARVSVWLDSWVSGPQLRIGDKMTADRVSHFCLLPRSSWSHLEWA